MGTEEKFLDIERSTDQVVSFKIKNKVSFIFFWKTNLQLLKIGGNCLLFKIFYLGTTKEILHLRH